jgi:asparagine synthase (glutamine-hydrolysing)
MCGIAGILQAGGGADNSPALHAMLAAELHRGPDGWGEYHDDHVSLGHRRLRIIDLSEGGKQPMADASGRYVVTFNGEIYNFQEVRKDLVGYPFSTTSDTEVLLAAWAQWGPACLEKFHGMFAFGLWDKQEGTLSLVRDRLGVKPLYYAEEGGQVIFASEVRALLASGKIKPRLRKEVLSDFLTYQTVAAPDTLLQGVNMLEPGTVLTFSKGKSKASRYYQAGKTLSPDAASVTYGEATKRVRQLLLASVERRLVADVPLGAFLSGGIDSSAIVALMAEVSGKPVDTFSVVFDEKEFDESEWSGLIARKYNTRHHPIKVRPDKFLEEVPATLLAMDHPSGDGPNSFVVSQVTKASGITVALSGIGGDELFAGYPFFRQLAELQSKRWLTAVPYPLRKLGAGIARVAPGGRRGQKLAEVLSARNFDLATLLPLYRSLYSNTQLAELLPDSCRRPNPVAAWMKAQESWLKPMPLLSQLSVAELTHYMQNVLLRDTDQMSMAHALEVREPFLDHELVEFVLALPDAHKFPTTPKRLLVDAMGDALPHELVHRKKMGFTFPWSHWLRNELRSFCEGHLTRLDQRGLLHPGAAMRQWQAFLAGDPKLLWNHLWLLVVLEHWLSHNQVEA